MTMGRWLGVAGTLVLLQAFGACGSESSEPPAEGQGGTDPQGQGGTNPKGQGGTNPQGQGGPDPQGQGGTDPDPPGTTGQGQGGTAPQAQGGSAGDTGLAGAGGQPDVAGAAGEGGAAGAAGACTTETGYECPACDEGYVHVECGGQHCVCEPEDGILKQELAAMLACDLDEPCPVSTQDSDIRWNSWENGECLLEALRDRTPGRFRLSASGGDAGYVYDDLTIILDGSDQVSVVEMQTSGTLSGNLTRWYLPATCTLKSYEELDDCVNAGTDVAGLMFGQSEICTSWGDWAENCEVHQDLECPGE